ncbi:MAG: methyltransferase domain-containing protein, partial [Cytophagales bacterium]|nr:methyltransferase domain-containing protein [Cytophagales bacterium]
VLMREEPNTELDEDDETAAPEPTSVREKRISLHQQRLETVFEKLRESGAKRVLDLGCGEGKLLRMLLKDKQFEEIVGMDVSHRSLEIAAERLDLDRLPEPQRKRITLLQGSLTYRDKRLQGYDAAALVEVIEHLDPNRLHALEAAVFGFAKPRTVVVTTPNAEYNRKYESLAAGRFRHSDHRFEWTRAEFQAWVAKLETFGYRAEIFSVGEEDVEVGASSQGAVLKYES